MAHYSKTDASDKNGFIHVYDNISSDDLADKVNSFILGKGYKLTAGEAGNGTYVRGNRVARILLGAFYKYFKWEVHTNANAEIGSVQLSKESSGMSGGVIGVNQVKKELAVISDLLQTI